jgi:NADH:ubiquinone oxidoreductase subunit E
MEKTATEARSKPEAGIGYTGEVSSQIQKVIKESAGRPGSLIWVLQHAQALTGYLPPPVLKGIARDMKVPLSEVYGIVSFYHFFTMVPRGKHVVQVCMGTSCYVKGGERILEAIKKDFGLEPEGITPDGVFSLEMVRCLGCCGLSPVMAIGEDVHRKVKASHVKDILNSYR